MSNKDLAEILFPNTLNIEDVLKKYPKRNKFITRYAPSPTGFTHLGNLYTAFLNYALARQNNGLFILRIEDTDQKRKVANGIENIITDLNDFGLSFDEGPIDLEKEKGSYGPYIQSKKQNIYDSFIKYLISIGRAYPCFCTDDELKHLHEEQEQKKIMTGYYGSYAKCRNLTNEEIITKINAGNPYVIRFKSLNNESDTIKVKDGIIKETILPANIFDIVIRKKDGLPTYHFAHVVDDFLMGTTLVIRDHNWFTSLPIHLDLFNALNITPPKYAHIPPVMINDNGTIRKLSKRKDACAKVSFYKELGIPNKALMLYLATLINTNFEGWYQNNLNKEILDFHFSLNKISKSGPLFDMDKLYNISKNYLSRLSAKDLYNLLLDYTETYDKDFYKLISNYPDKTISILNIEREVPKPRKDYQSLSVIKNYIWFMYDELFKGVTYEWQQITDINQIKDITTTYLSKYYQEDMSKEEWLNNLKLLADDFGYSPSNKEYKENPSKYKGSISDITTVLRVSLTSKKDTFDLYEIMHILGLEEMKKRIALLK